MAAGSEKNSKKGFFIRLATGFGFFILAVLVIIVLATFTRPPGPQCIYNDSTSLQSSGSFSVGANSQSWTKAFHVEDNAEITVSPSGSINLCPDSREIFELKTTGSGPRAPLPTSNTWKDTKLSVTKGQILRFNFADNSYYSFFSAKGDIACEDVDDPAALTTQCYWKEGQKLYAYIGSPPSSSWWPDSFSEGITWQELFDFSFDKEEIASEHKERFYPIENYPGGEFQVKETGKLYLRYLDQKNGNTDNSGGYETTISVVDTPCLGRDGQYMVGYIAEDDKNIPTLTSPTQEGVYNFYESDDNLDKNHPKKITANATGYLWLRIIDDPSIAWSSSVSGIGDGIYEGGARGAVIASANAGSYSVTIKAPNAAISPSDTLSRGFITALVNPIRILLLGDPNETDSSGLAKKLYTSLVENSNYILSIQAVLALSIAVFGFMFMVGLSQITQKEFIIYTLRIAAIIVLISPTSWEFFSTYLFSFFVEGLNGLVLIFSESVSQGLAPITGVTITAADATEGEKMAHAFSALDATFSLMFNETTWIKLSSLLHVFPMGWVYFLVMMAGITYFLVAVIKVMLIYIGALVFIAFSIFLAPIFIPLVMFEKTRYAFDAWVKNMASYVLQAVFAVLALLIFNAIIFVFYQKLLDFSVCWSCFLNIDLPFSKIFDLTIGNIVSATGGDEIRWRAWSGTHLNFDNICLFFAYVPWGHSGSMSSSVGSSPVTLLSLGMFLFLMSLLNKVIAWIVDLGKTVTSGGSGESLGAVAKGGMAEGQNIAATTLQGAGGVLSGVKSLVSGAVSAYSAVKDRIELRGNESSFRAQKRDFDNLVARSDISGIRSVGSSGAGGETPPPLPPRPGAAPARPVRPYAPPFPDRPDAVPGEAAPTSAVSPPRMPRPSAAEVASLRGAPSGKAAPLGKRGAPVQSPDPSGVSPRSGAESSASESSPGGGGIERAAGPMAMPSSGASSPLVSPRDRPPLPSRDSDGSDSEDSSPNARGIASHHRDSIMEGPSMDDDDPKDKGADKKPNASSSDDSDGDNGGKK